jgi:hypothetical protein
MQVSRKLLQAINRAEYNTAFSNGSVQHFSNPIEYFKDSIEHFKRFVIGDYFWLMLHLPSI